MNHSFQKGHTHPITHIINKIAGIFVSMGFEIMLGPEIETEYYNFDSLNMPKDHPARDMQDTFWIKNKKKTLLRTQTSAMQARYMETHKPPFKIIAVGKVFRNEATDSTHNASFHQIEGLVVGKNINLANLKGTLNYFLHKLFGNNIKTQFRPGYFPFVEPGIEIDMVCFRCGGKGCPTCKQSGWIEILGAGIVHPKVLSNSKINPNKWQGFAFGIGIERLAMLKYDITDVRMFSNGDLRLVNQF